MGYWQPAMGYGRTRPPSNASERCASLSKRTLRPSSMAGCPLPVATES